MSVSYKVIGRHIQEARKRMKLTQREIAEKLNMSDTQAPPHQIFPRCRNPPCSSVLSEQQNR